MGTPHAPHGKHLGVAYSIVASVAALASVGIWLLMLIDEERSVGSTTLDMVVKFTNLTVVLVALVAAWIATGRSPGPVRSVAHLTVMVMAVITAVVNATLLDAALPAGWWGVVDLAQHYVIPIAVVAAWATLGPPVDVPWSRLGWILVVPAAWLAFVLVRGSVSDLYPYDFVDPAQNGWAGVLAMSAAILVAMLGAGAAFTSVDHRRAR